MASFNLLHDAWIPVRLADGTGRWISPWRITEGLPDNPPVSIDWPRPDFNGAGLEFLIGLLATAFAPRDEDEWHSRWEHPPRPDELQAAFSSIAFAFNLDGDGPCFMQDLDPLEDVEARGIESLLIDQPGDQTLRYNKDLFVKRGGIGLLGRPAAAMALYTTTTTGSRVPRTRGDEPTEGERAVQRAGRSPHARG